MDKHNISMGLIRNLMNRGVLLLCIMMLLVPSCANRQSQSGGSKPAIEISRVGLCEHNKLFPPTSAIKAKEQIIFTVEITNRSKIKLTKVKVSDHLPRGMRLLKGRLEARFDEISPGETVGFRFTLDSGNPETYIMPGVKVEYDAENRHYVTIGEELYVDVQLITSC